jgi:hypothetical protein
MAKEDYLQGYSQGLQRGTEGPVKGYINKTLDIAIGNPHDSAKRGVEQGYQEMKAAKEAEAMRAVKGMKKGGKVSSASSRADGCCTKGKTKGRII